VPSGRDSAISRFSLPAKSLRITIATADGRNPTCMGTVFGAKPAPPPPSRPPKGRLIGNRYGSVRLRTAC
jgi:hypothetical protein